MNANSSKANPFLTGLNVVATVAIALAGVLALLGWNESRSFSADIETIAGLNTWSNLLLASAAVAYVGAAVLAGARWLLASAPVSPVKAAPAEATHLETDGV